MISAGERTWVPQPYLDELTPPGRASPSEWIDQPPDGGGFRLHAAFRGDTPRALLAPGDIVGFHACDDFGEINVIVRSDGTFQPLGEVPSEVTAFWEGGNPETLADTLKDFAAGYAEWLKASSAESEETVAVRMARWSDNQPHRLVVENGAARFVVAVPS